MVNSNLEESSLSSDVGLLSIPNTLKAASPTHDGYIIRQQPFLTGEYRSNGNPSNVLRKPISNRLGSLNGEYPYNNSLQSSEVIDLTLLDEEVQDIKPNSIPQVPQSQPQSQPQQQQIKPTTAESNDHDNGGDDEDEIIELDPVEATKITAFRERLNKRRMHHSPLLNNPAPVPHFPPNPSNRLTHLTQEMVRRRHLLTEMQIEMGSSARRLNTMMQNLRRLVKEEADNEQLLQINPTAALDPADIHRRLTESKRQIQQVYQERAALRDKIESLKRMVHLLQQEIDQEQRNIDIKPHFFEAGDDERKEELRKRYRIDNNLLQQSSGTSVNITQSNGVFGKDSGFIEVPDDEASPIEVIREWENQQEAQISGPAYYTSGQNNDETSHLSELLDNIKPDIHEGEADDDGLPPRPEGMRSDLYKHQKIGLSWLIRMENSKSRGGLLADAMGLGKTIQTIALIMAHKSEDLDVKTTLIVAPVSLLRQWHNEIKLHTTGVSVGLFHGAGKKQFSSFRDLKRFDVIMTSYTTLGNEFRKHYAKLFSDNQMSFTQNIIPDHGTGGEEYNSPFYSKDSQFYRVVLDEAQNIKNKTTISCKAVTTLSSKYRFCLTGTPMQNSVDELFPIIRFLRIKPYSREESFKLNISQPLKSDKSDKYDKERSMNRLRALLRAILLRRNKDSEIDGKPILNLPEKHIIDKEVAMDPEEFETYQSIEKQLQTRAKRLLIEDGNFSNFLVLLLRLRQACCHTFLCEIGSVGKFEQFRFENIGNLYKAIDRISPEEKDSVMADLRSCLGDGILKEEAGNTDEEKPQSDDDMELIQLLSSQTNRSTPDIKKLDDENEFISEFDKEVNKFNGKTEQIENLLENKDEYTGVNGNFHGSATGINDNDLEVDLNQYKTDEEGVFTCSSCFISYTFESAIRFPCSHKVCEDCIASFVEENKVDDKSVKCFECQEIFSIDRFIDYKTFKMKELDKKSKIEIKNYVEECFKGKLSVSEKIKKLIVKHQGLVYSTKMQEALNLIEKILTDFPGEKIIVFSQFTTFFDLLKYMFNKAGIPTLRYDGTMSLEKKDLTVQQFYQNSKYKIMLTSLKAGNVGLTLNCASHVIILDPFWNPYVEEQAMDRAHRIGQTKEVYVYRILIKNTVEERIITLQNKKKSLINAAMDEKSIQSVSRLSRQDLRYLFGL